MSAGWQRRARPLLGTLVEVGVPAQGGDDAVAAAFGAVAAVQAAMSRFDPASDVGRFHALSAGQGCTVRPATVSVLLAAAALQRESGGLFDITQGSAPAGWRIEGRTWWRLNAAARVDLGGIAKGYVVDRAVIALRRHGCAGGWVNAGGDLRAFGSAELPLQLRDEVHGGVEPDRAGADGRRRVCDQHAAGAEGSAGYPDPRDLRYPAGEAALHQVRAGPDLSGHH